MRAHHHGFPSRVRGVGMCMVRVQQHQTEDGPKSRPHVSPLPLNLKPSISLPRWKHWKQKTEHRFPELQQPIGAHRPCPAAAADNSIPRDAKDANGKTVNLDTRAESHGKVQGR